MATEQAQKFLKSLADNAAERKKLHSAIAADIVKAGKAAGYTFTEQELGQVMQSGSSGSGTALGTSVGWG